MQQRCFEKPLSVEDPDQTLLLSYQKPPAAGRKLIGVNGFGQPCHDRLEAQRVEH